MTEDCTDITGGILSSPNFDMRSFIFTKYLLEPIQSEKMESNTQVKSGEYLPIVGMAAYTPKPQLLPIIDYIKMNRWKRQQV